MENIIPYLIISKPCGKFFKRDHLENFIHLNLVELLEENYLISVFNNHNLDYEYLIKELPYGHHPSFAFNNLNIELCLGDYV